jgi:hypothetical protein
MDPYDNQTNRHHPESCYRKNHIRHLDPSIEAIKPITQEIISWIDSQQKGNAHQNHVLFGDQKQDLLEARSEHFSDADFFGSLRNSE